MAVTASHLLQLLRGAGSLTVSVSMLTATVSVLTPTVTGDRVISTSMLTLTLSQPTSTVAVGGDATVSATLLTLTLSQPTSTVAVVRNVTISATEQQLTFSVSTPSISAGNVETWSQHGATSARIGSSDITPTTPWRWLWSVGPDTTGGISTYPGNIPPEAFPVCGGTRIFQPRGGEGVSAYLLATGVLSWSYPYHEFVAPGAYDLTTDCVIFGSTNGRLYKIPAGYTGDPDTALSFNCGSPIRKAVCLVGRNAYVSCEDGSLQKIDITLTAGGAMSLLGKYQHSSTTVGTRAETPPSYSSTGGSTGAAKLVYATSDGFVHAVRDSSLTGGSTITSGGTGGWRVKPSSNTWGWPNTFERSWPVVAETHGVVMVRCQLTHDSMGTTPGGSSPFPGTNAVATDCAATRTWLNSNTQYQNLFAMDLTDGSAKFVPAVGYGSVEDRIIAPDNTTGNNSYGTAPPMPSVRRYSAGGGNEVAYCHFRNGAWAIANGWDYRWDGNLGEMVLDTTTISGLAAGDLRFVKMGDQYSGGTGYIRIIDEENQVTALGDMIFHSHWAGAEGVQITNRGSSLGLATSTPIAATALTTVIWGKSASGTNNPATHYCSDNGGAVQSRSYTNPVFWVYRGVNDPPPGPGKDASTWSAGFASRYVFVHKQYLVFCGNGGDITVMRHSGTVSGVSAPGSPTALTVTSPSSQTTANVGVATSNIVYAFSPADSILPSGSVTVTPTDGAGSGTFSPATLTLTQTNPAGVVVYTANSADAGSSVSLTCTNNGSLADP